MVENPSKGFLGGGGSRGLEKRVAGIEGLQSRGTGPADGWAGVRGELEQ